MSKLYRWLILGLLGLFVVGLVVGTLLPVSAKLLILQSVAEKFEGILTASPSDWSLAWHIFLNNLLVCAILYIGGFIFIVPVFIVLSNGVMIGVLMAVLQRAAVLLPGYFLSALVGLVPHGLFELAAFFLSGALGMVVMIKILWPQVVAPDKLRRTVLLESLRWFALSVTPLLVIAALVETFVSPRLTTLLHTWYLEQKLDPTLAVQLDATTLKQYDCTAKDATTHTLDTATADVAAQNLIILARTVYDEPLYQTLRQRQAIPFWQATLVCAEQSQLQIQSWRTQDWSPAQASTTSIAMQAYSKVQHKQKRTDNAIRFSYTMANIPVVQTILSNHHKTIVITQTNPTFSATAIIAPPGLTEPN